MLMRHLGRFRAALALGFVSSAALALGGGRPAAAGDVPATETVSILEARKSGDLDVLIRGQGDDRVKFEVTNRSARRLNVVIPPGLVASASTSQGGGLGGGFQSMGLGGLASNPGRFGAYRPANAPGEGFRSVPAVNSNEALALSPGQTLDFTMPSVCLNFGVNTPTPRNQFELVTIDDYTPDVRARAALRTLATLGTSQGVAQAVAWHVFNGMSFSQISAQNAKLINSAELGLAMRFVEALDNRGPGELVDSAYFDQNRILVRVRGESNLAKDAQRLALEFDGLRMFGLPVRLVDEIQKSPHPVGALFLDVVLTAGNGKLTAARVGVRASTPGGTWSTLGNVDLREPKPCQELTGEILAEAVGRAVARQFVAVAPVRRNANTTVVKLTNRLPLTLAHVTLKAGKTAADLVLVDAIGIGPLRNANVPIPAATATVDQIIFNGL